MPAPRKPPAAKKAPAAKKPAPDRQQQLVDQRRVLEPHPLVYGLSAANADYSPGDASRVAIERVIGLLEFPEGTAPQGPTETTINDFGVTTEKPYYKVLAGYLGGVVTKGDPAEEARLLYLDATLSSWLLVPSDGILLHSRTEDLTAAYGLRDLLWVRSDARIVQGTAADSVQRNYLNGPFLRSDEIAATVTGGTLPRQGGLLQEAITPGCCTGNSRR